MRSRFKAGRFRKTRRKPCLLCVDRAEYLDYKAYQKLRKFTSDRGKILPRKTTGTCARHQRWVSQAVKRAREIALLPFVSE